MPFNTQNFIFVFLPAFFLSYLLISDNLKNAVILIYSVLFYIIGNYNNPFSIIILLLLTLLNYLFGYLIISCKNNTIDTSKKVLILSIVFNVCILILFKSNIVIKEMPLGMSFYIFHFISILVDSYQYNQVSKKYNLKDYLYYILYFPKILSGPITRYDYFIKSYSNKLKPSDCFLKGFFYFSIGLSLKCIFPSKASLISFSFLGL